MTNQSKRNIRAFRINCLGKVSIVYAENANKAKYFVFRCANAAGYDVNFKDMRCRRAPSEDVCVLTRGGVTTAGRCYSPDSLSQEKK